MSSLFSYNSFKVGIYHNIWHRDSDSATWEHKRGESRCSWKKKKKVEFRLISTVQKTKFWIGSKESQMWKNLSVMP